MARCSGLSCLDRQLLYLSLIIISLCTRQPHKLRRASPSTMLKVDGRRPPAQTQKENAHLTRSPPSSLSCALVCADCNCVCQRRLGITHKVHFLNTANFYIGALSQFRQSIPIVNQLILQELREMRVDFARFADRERNRRRRLGRPRVVPRARPRAGHTHAGVHTLRFSLRVT
eukprot:COSAG02_NODE_3000_length_7578_cov_218.918305_4_plen_173_part_00